MHDRREKRVVHGLTAARLFVVRRFSVASARRPPWRAEARHYERARVGAIATGDLAAVTCRKCKTLMHRSRREGPGMS